MSTAAHVEMRGRVSHAEANAVESHVGRLRGKWSQVSLTRFLAHTHRTCNHSSADKMSVARGGGEVTIGANLSLAIPR